MIFLLVRAVVILLFVSLTPMVEAEEPDCGVEALQNCFYYRAKRDGVPVYMAPDRASGALSRLELGEHVCYIGEQGEFAIVDWRRQGLINERAECSDPEADQEMAFVRLHDLWEPRGGHGAGPGGSGQRDIGERAKQLFNYMRHGGVPEDALAPFRPFLRPFSRGPTCKAGKICEQVERDLKEAEEKR